MTLVGVLDSIGHEVGQQLLYTSLVKIGEIGVVRIVFDELHSRFLNTLFECLADIVESLGNIDLFRKDGKSLSHIGGFEDVVDEAHEHIAVAADNADELQAFLVGFHHRQEV